MAIEAIFDMLTSVDAGVVEQSVPEQMRAVKTEYDGILAEVYSWTQSSLAPGILLASGVAVGTGLTLWIGRMMGKSAKD